ncbi:MAG TPA: hypothetical protein VG014_05750 [Acidimicrobiales bacterium]|nr:hypothetical protein [Acidimicrobiales bacterium]
MAQVTRGLGPQQLATLAMLAERRHGMFTVDVATLLNVEPRRARAIIASLVDRDLAVVTRDPGEAPRVWLPDRRRVWVGNREWVRFMLDHWCRGERTCPTCGAIRTDPARDIRLRPVESA